MSKIDVYLVVEGQTEQTFIRDILAPEMAQKDIFLYPALIGKPGHKGGNIRFKRAKDDMGKFLMQRNDCYVSIMVDYFQIDSEWPGHDEINQKIKAGMKMSSVDKASLINKATHKVISDLFSENNADKRFISYIEMHEFEALLFSDATILASSIGVDLENIMNILNTYDGPEEINADPACAPSKRLIELKKDYRKVAMGKIISESIGIKTIREKCLNFDSWLKQLESLRNSRHTS